MDITQRYGKSLTNEPAIISLTSWVKRIHTCGLTIFNLYKTCPGYHIVLTLAEEEFPQLLTQLPRDLLIMLDKGIYELIFVKKNWKAFKKCIFSMSLYNTIPIITADDDMIYTTNYALELVNSYKTHRTNVITYRKSTYVNHISGPCTLFPPELSHIFLSEFKNNPPIELTLDDGWFDTVINKNDIKVIPLHDYFPCKVHDEIAPLSGGIDYHPEWRLSRI